MRVLVLGTGNAQVDVLELFSGEHEVFAVSNSTKGRGMKFVDFFEFIDIKEQQTVLRYAEKHNIELVCSVGSDLAMVTSAWVSNQLGLPSFITPELATICNTKDLLRKHLGDFKGNIKFTVLEKQSDNKGLDYPVIIKPVDSQGQRGVYLVTNNSEFTKKYPLSLSFSKSGRVIAEEFIDGPEISVNCYVTHGEIRFLIISDRLVWPDLPGGIIHKHRIPSQFSDTDVTDQIHCFLKDVIIRLGISNGPVYSQIKMLRNQPKLIEITPRIDGCHLWRLIRFATGFDLLKSYVRHLTGHAPVNFTTNSEHDDWVLEFMCARPGTVFNRDSFNVKKAIYHEWYYENGQRVGSVNNFMEKCGYKIYRVHK